MTQSATMALSAVPTGHLFTFDNGQTMYKVLAKAGMGPQTVLHCQKVDTATGTLTESPFEARDPAQLAGQVLAAPDPAGPAAGIAPPAPAAQPAPTLATAAQEAAANAAVVGAFPGATPVTVGGPEAAVPAVATASTGNSALSRLAHSRMQHFGPDRVAPDPRSQAISTHLGNVAAELSAQVGSGPDVVAGIDALLAARDAFVRAALATS